MSLQAIVFDFDGVIADSEPLHLRACQTVLRQDHIELDEDDYYARYVGYDDAGLFDALAKDRGIEVDPARIQRWIESKSKIVERLLASGSILFPGAADCVKRFAQRVPLAIASGALEPEITLVLERAGLREYFTVIASASDGVRGKPAPDLYLLAIAKLRAKTPIEAAACVAIEDSRWGLESARLAGLRCVAVTHTYEADQLDNADLVVQRLGDLTISRVEELMRDNGPAR